MKFDDLIEKVFNESAYPKLDKLAKKLSDSNFWDEGKWNMEQHFKDHYNGEDEWAEEATAYAVKAVKEKYGLDKKDEKILNELLLSYSYILETRGI